jgi:hypothetical protein
VQLALLYLGKSLGIWLVSITGRRKNNPMVLGAGGFSHPRAPQSNAARLNPNV